MVVPSSLSLHKFKDSLGKPFCGVRFANSLGTLTPDAPLQLTLDGWNIEPITVSVD